MSELIKIDVKYREWIQDVGQRFRINQIKAASKVNEQLLRFYWSLGRDISLMKLDAKYGAQFYKQLSRDIQAILPDARSFSVSNLKYMRYFYEMYPTVSNRQQLADDLKIDEMSQSSGVDLSPSENRQQLADDLDEQIIFRIPWGHHILLLGKCKEDRDKALFYVRKTLENNWSRAVLTNFLDSNLYERQGKAVSNFALTLPAPQSDLAQAITRDPYCFDFLTIREKFDEKELKDAMMNSAEKFFMELGEGFAFLGREVRLEVGETEKFIDLLFYNVRIHCYVVVEVKATDFDSAYAGQLGTYVVAVNRQMKTERDAPTIGVLICKNMDRVEARYALEASSQPLGVSTYQLSRIVPKEFKGTLPTIKEIEAEFADKNGEFS